MCFSLCMVDFCWLILLLYEFLPLFGRFLFYIACFMIFLYLEDILLHEWIWYLNIVLQSAWKFNNSGLIVDRILEWHLVKIFYFTLVNVGVWGGKGQGKSFQTELIFRAMGIEPVILSAGELESERAGCLFWNYRKSSIQYIILFLKLWICFLFQCKFVHGV